LDLCSFDKVNGILMRFKNDNTMNYPFNVWQGVSHNAMLARSLESLRFQFSGVDKDTNTNGNISSRYVSGYCTDVPGGSREFTLEIYKGLSNYGPPKKNYYEDIVNKNMWMMSISGKNFGQLRKIKSVKLDNPQDFSLLKIVLESGFDNIIEQYDRFTIINKQNEIRFIDIGDNMKDGEVPDIIARYSDDLTIGHYYDIKRQKMNNLVYDEIIRSNDYIYIGHRHRFNSAIVAIDINTASDYYWKIAWYLRRDFYDVEYWNGSSWSKVTDLTMIPTSVVNERDTAGTQIEKDDIIKYRMLFDAPDWQCGGYDANDYNSGESPSNIEEDKMYLIRVKLTISIPVYLKYVSLADRMELNLAVIWEDMPEWGRNEISIESGKYIVDTLTYDFLTLNMYRIRVTANENFYAAMIMCRPITKLKGSLGDNLYVVADPSNIDINIDKDVIIYDKNKINNISVMPVNASYSYLIGKILDDCNLVLGHKTKLSADHNNDISRNIVNPIGSGYDGVYPVDVGWEKVVVTEKITHNITGEYRHICVIRDAGVYRAFCVTRDGTEVHMWISDDMITWANQGNIVTNIGAKIIHAVDVVKNKDDSKYAFYITAK